MLRNIVERIQSTEAHIVGAVLTKSTDGASKYGYGPSGYGYRQLDDRRNEIVMLPGQPEK